MRGVGYLPLWSVLDLTDDATLDVSLVRQPATYNPVPLELMPPEKPIPPAGYLDSNAGPASGR